MKKIINKKIESKKIESKKIDTETNNEDDFEFAEEKTEPIKPPTQSLNIDNIKIKTINENINSKLNKKNENKIDLGLNFDVEEKEHEFNEKRTIEINQDLLSLMSGIGSENINKIEEKKEEEKKEEKKEEIFDENKMMEMLIKIGGKNPNEKKIEKPKKETQQDKNDKKIIQIISTLPNYNFLTSKYIEFPETMYNLLE